MTTTRCAGQHHLTVLITTPANIYLTPDEQTFEFHGTTPEHLTIWHLECTECDYTADNEADIPADLLATIHEALAGALIMQPLVR